MVLGAVFLIGDVAVAAPRTDLPAGFPTLKLSGRIRGDAAVSALDTNLPAIAAFYKTTEDELRKRFREDRMLWADADGRLLYVCDFIIPPATNSGPEFHPAANSPAGFPYEQTFRLHSRPGATKLIYLDFDGHDASATSWGNDAIARPYDIDGDPSTFSNTERDRIQYIWQRVAEDFALYDMDVTTEDPGVEALRKANSGDAYYGIRVGIGGSSADWYGSAGGVAYIGSFNWNSDTPCWVFPKSLGDSEKNIAEATSHEVGHTLGLGHDGQTGTGNGYYYGHGNWAPIMGVGYNEPVVQWSRGEYTLANNQQDDLTVMLNYGINYRTDDHGGSLVAATTIIGPGLSKAGNIERTSDVDFFSFQTGAGRVAVTATPSARSPNLHVLLSLYDENGVLLLSTNKPDTSGGTQPASFAMILPTGKYYLSVDGIGEGDPVNTGYSDYGSLGQYTITGTLPSDSAWLPTPADSYSWTNVANWASNTVPIGPGVAARFVNNIDGDQIVNLDQPIAVGRLFLADADGTSSFTIQDGDGGPLIFSSMTGPAGLHKNGSAADVIAATTVLQTNLFVTNLAAGNLTFSGGISGIGGMTKLGPGSLTLAASNSFQGPLSVADGTVVLGPDAVLLTSQIEVSSNALLDVSVVTGGFTVRSNQSLAGSGAVVGNAAVAGGALLLPGGTNAAGTLSFSNNLSLDAGATIVFDLSSTPIPETGVNDQMIVAGDLSFASSVNVDFQFINGAPASPGTYRIMQYAGSLISGASNLVSGGASNRFLFTFDDSVPGEIKVHVSGTPASLVWQGDGSLNRWDVLGTSNWLNAGNPESFAQLDAVQFDDAGSTSPNVNLFAALLPASVTVNAATNYTFAGSGKVSGDATLTKTGSGTLTLNNANDFTGATTVTEGTLKIGNGAALGTTNGTTSIAAGAKLDLAGFSLGAEPVLLAGAITNSSANAQTNALRFVTLTGDAVIGGNGRWDIRANPSGSLLGAFNLTKVSANEVWLAGLGTNFLGNITVAQGLLGIEDSTTLGDASKSLTLAPGTTLAMSYTDINSLSKKLFLTNATLRSDAGNNIFAGGVTLNATNTINVAAGLSLTGVVGGSGGLTKTGSGILTLSAANTFTGAVSVSAGTLRARNSAALGVSNGPTIINAGGRLDVNGINLGAEPVVVQGTGLGNAGAIINFGSAQNNALRFVTLAGNTTFGGISRWDIRANPTASLTGNGFNLIKTGPNEIWLVDVGSSGLGNITVNEGLFGVQGTSTLGNASSTLAVSSTSFGIWATGTNALSKVMTLSSARLYNGSGTNLFAGPITLTGSNSFDIVTNTLLTISNLISGSGSLHFINTGRLVLATNNTYSGATRIAYGTLHVGSGLGFGTLGTGNVTNDAALVFNRSNDFTTANLITGNGSLTKQGGGTLTLSAANNYNGPTTVSAGALKAGNASAFGSLSNGTVVASGATLDVNGFNLGAEVVTVSGAGVAGNGAIVNSGSVQSNALRYVTLSGNATFGGANRWDIRDPGAGGASALSGGYALTKVSGNQIWLANLGITTLGNITINSGSLVIQGTTTLGNSGSLLSLSNGATFGIVGTGANVLSKALAMTNATVWSGGGSNTLLGAKSLTGAAVFDVATGSTLVSPGGITGTGELTKINPGTLLLTGNSAFSGNVTVAGGTLAVSAAGAVGSSPIVQVNAGALFDVSAVAGGFTLGAAQTLRGNGTIAGTISSIGTIAPGTSIGRLTFNESLTLAGNLTIETSKSGVVLTNDSLAVGGTLNLGGTLTVAHGGSPLAAGDSFTLYTAAGLNGDFGDRNYPPLAGGLRWDDSLLATSGLLSVAVITPPVLLPPVYDGTNLWLQIASETGVTYVLETAAALDPPVFWTPVGTNSGTGGQLSFAMPLMAEEAQRFFRVNAY